MATRTPKTAAKATKQSAKASKAAGKAAKAPAAPVAARRRKAVKPAEPVEAPEPDHHQAPPVAESHAPPMAAIERAEPEESRDGAPVQSKAPTSPSQAAPPSRTNGVDGAAGNVAEELMRRRSKPIVIEADDSSDALPVLPVGRRAQAEAPNQVLHLHPAPPAKAGDLAAPRGLSIPEHYILLTLDDDWDERRERIGAPGLGGGLIGALLLDLVRQGKLRVQRDRFQVTDAAVDDAGALVLEKLALKDGETSQAAMRRLAKWLPQLLAAYKDRLQERGLIEHRQWRHLGLFHRSQAVLLDEPAQERLRNKLARAIAGGGRPDAATILSLGLLEASGLFGLVVPEGAQAYNRKRLNGLLGGKDVMGYKVDDELRGVQEMAVRTVLDNVRQMAA